MKEHSAPIEKIAQQMHQTAKLYREANILFDEIRVTLSEYHAPEEILVYGMRRLKKGQDVTDMLIDRWKEEIEKHEEQYTQFSKDKPISHMNLSVRTKNTLIRHFWCECQFDREPCVNDLILLGSEGIKAIQSVGITTFSEIADELVRHYGEKEEDWNFRKR
ncbi:MAG: hypothetical protein V3G42_15955 [Oscillospiraceae bacterium]